MLWWSLIENTKDVFLASPQITSNAMYVVESVVLPLVSIAAGRRITKQSLNRNVLFEQRGCKLRRRWRSSRSVWFVRHIFYIGQERRNKSFKWCQRSSTKRRVIQVLLPNQSFLSRDTTGINNEPAAEIALPQQCLPKGPMDVQRWRSSIVHFAELVEAEAMAPLLQTREVLVGCVKKRYDRRIRGLHRTNSNCLL